MKKSDLVAYIKKCEIQARKKLNDAIAQGDDYFRIYYDGMVDAYRDCWFKVYYNF